MGDRVEKEKSVEKNSVKESTLLPLLPLREVILFPHMVIPLFVARERSIAALEAAIQNRLDLFFCAQKDASIVNPKEDDIYTLGTLGNIVQIVKLPDNTVKIIVEGKKRAIIKEFLPNDQFIQVKVEELEEEELEKVKLEALLRGVKSIFETYVKFNKRIPPEVVINISAIEDASRLADVVVAHLTLKLEKKQQVLEIVNLPDRLEKILTFMREEIEILQIEKKISSRVKQQMERNQKEYYLNEQMNAIQKELGEKDEFKIELGEIEKKICDTKLSKEAAEKVRKEYNKLKSMSPMSAESAVVRSYIDWALSLPWGKYTKDSWDLEQADKVLKKNHYGLDDVRERILEFLSICALTGNSKGSILCFVGPPGVGKTSLARSIAQSVKKKFVRASLGGVRDEAEIRGHRRTYVGALPGKLIQSLKKAGSSNPVFLLDEIDKMSSDFRGDPASALLEVLDKEQNNSFMDHYLEVEFDLSQILFILTANSLHSIPKPLLDRMEVVRIPGYTTNEKLHIAEKHLIPQQIKEHGLMSESVLIPSETLTTLITGYTREAGVRNLEREISCLLRKTAHEIMKKYSHKATEAKKNVKQSTTRKKILNALLKEKVDILPTDLSKMLGPRVFTANRVGDRAVVGLANGLAWTESGGDMLQIEVAILPGRGTMKVTGKLGEVMQESAQAAFSYVRSRSRSLGLSEKFYDSIDVHVHVPEGAVPKDGPSAGITIATALVSAFLGVSIRKNVAMTGEITLLGRVLPIGGLKEKLIAARVGGADTVIFPKENERELEKVSSEILEGITLCPASHADEVLRIALEIEDPKSFMKAELQERSQLEEEIALEQQKKNQQGTQVAH